MISVALLNQPGFGLVPPELKAEAPFRLSGWQIPWCCSDDDCRWHRHRFRGGKPMHVPSNNWEMPMLYHQLLPPFPPIFCFAATIFLTSLCQWMLPSSLCRFWPGIIGSFLRLVLLCGRPQTCDLHAPYIWLYAWYPPLAPSEAAHWVQGSCPSLVLPNRWGPSYLTHLRSPSLSAGSTRHLRSAEQGLLHVSFAHTSAMQSRAFSVVGPLVRNGLPLVLRSLLPEIPSAT